MRMCATRYVRYCNPYVLMPANVMQTRVHEASHVVSTCRHLISRFLYHSSTCISLPSTLSLSFSKHRASSAQATFKQITRHRLDNIFIPTAITRHARSAVLQTTRFTVSKHRSRLFHLQTLASITLCSLSRLRPKQQWLLTSLSRQRRFGCSRVRPASSMSPRAFIHKGYGLTLSRFCHL